MSAFNKCERKIVYPKILRPEVLRNYQNTQFHSHFARLRVRGIGQTSLSQPPFGGRTNAQCRQGSTVVYRLIRRMITTRNDIK